MMRLRILLVNPWIYDFAAYNLWARPLGLLRVAEYLSAFDTEVCLIDCTDSGGRKRYGTGKFRAETVPKPGLLKDVPRRFKRYGISVDEFVKKLGKRPAFDMVLMTSLMSWWYPGVQKTTEIIRDVMGDVPVLLGGIYATLYHEHAARSSGADFIFRGPLNESIQFAFYTFGFRLRKKGAPRPYYRLNLCDPYPYAAVLASTGCPFQCSYCASRLLSPSLRRRSPEEVVREVKDLSDMGTEDVAFYDDALLVDPEDFAKPMLRGLVRECSGLRFHTPNGLHARFVDRELAALMREAGFKTIRLSLETVDVHRQKTSGNKVTNEDLERAVGFLTQEGFTKKEVGIYLMYGLPGQEWEEVRAGIDFVMRLGVGINLTEFSPVKGTQSWHELVQRGIIDDSLDPLLTNNSVFSHLHSGYDPAEVERTKLELKRYNGESRDG